VPLFAYAVRLSLTGNGIFGYVTGIDEKTTAVVRFGMYGTSVGTQDLTVEFVVKRLGGVPTGGTEYTPVEIGKFDLTNPDPEAVVKFFTVAPTGSGAVNMFATRMWWPLGSRGASEPVVYTPDERILLQSSTEVLAFDLRDVTQPVDVSINLLILEGGAAL